MLTRFAYALIRPLVALALCWAGAATAQVCAPPSLLLTSFPQAIINDYYAPANGSTLNTGATSLTLGTRDPRGYTATLVIGDLLMLMQMQDGRITSANNSTYGDGSGSGSGTTNVDNAGLYEFVRITGISGSNISFVPPLAKSYINQDSTAGTSQKRYQVIRVLQFASANTTIPIQAPAWNGATGGVVAMDVRDTLTLTDSAITGTDSFAGSAAIFVGGKGFRGGFAVGSGASTATSNPGGPDYARNSGNGHSGKGEGFIGTPRFVATKPNGWGFQTSNPPTALTTAAGANEGYPGGSYGIGAPGNAGGGGYDGTLVADSNQYNAGGGGGGNYGPGGIGGRPYNFPLNDHGGRPGAGYAGTLAFNRVFMGGGGGAGNTNNLNGDGALTTLNPNQAMVCTINDGSCASGAAGGGIVIIRARAIAGSGTINARGAHAYQIVSDAAGGGGAGGSVVIETPNGGTARVDVRGGDGGNAWPNAAQPWPALRHGPGGAGGGGFVAYAPATMGITALVDGGAPGQTLSTTVPVANRPESYGSTGYNGGITNFLSPNVPGVVQAAKCDPSLSLAKSDGLTNLTAGQTTSYVLTVTNTGSSDTSGTVTIGDRMTTALSVTPGPLTLSGAYAVQWSCVASTAQDITCESTASIPAGATRSFSYLATVSALTPNGSAIVNRAQISGGGDPLKTTTATPITAATCTSTNTPIAGCALDSGTVVAPNLTLSKTNNATLLARGSTVTYTLTVANIGGASSPGASGTITVADVIPIGMTYSGVTPFTVNGFTCNVGATTTTGQGLVCDSAAPLAASTSALITYTVLVGNSPPGSVINKAQVGGGGDPSPGKSVRPTTATAVVCPDPTPPAVNYSDPDTGCAADADEVRYVSLDLTKTDNTISVPRGGTTTYQFTVRNIGTIATSGQLNFRDVLPGVTSTFQITGTYTPSGTNGANWSCTQNTTTGTFCVSNTSIPAGGSSTFNLQVFIDPATTIGAFLFNRSRIGGGGDVSTGTVNSPTVADVSACTSDGLPTGCAVDLDQVQAATPKVRMTKTHTPAGPVSVGSSITYTLVITNSGAGPGLQRSVTMVDYLPTGLTVNTVTLTPVGVFTCGTFTRAVGCTNTAAAFAANTNVTVTVGVTVAAGATATMVNASKVSASGTTADPQNSTLPTTTTAALCTGVDVPNFGCAADTLLLNADPQIFKDQRLGSSGVFQSTLLGVSRGDTVQFQITAVNPAGSAGMLNLGFSDSIPGSFSTVTTVSATASGSASGCTVGSAGNLVTGNVAGFPPNSTCTVVVQAVAATNTTGAGITNTVALVLPAGINDTNLANNTATVATAIGAANLAVAKTNGVVSLLAGSTTTYTVTVANFGPSPAPGTVLTDAASSGLNCTSVTCSSTAVNMCPVTSITYGSLTTGVQIAPSFPANSTATFVVTCGVSATGR